MIMPSQIADAINEMLAEKYPKITVYINSCPKEFSRPSFCVKTVKAMERPANRNAVKIRARFNVTYFAAADQNGNINFGQLVEIQAGIMSIFRKGYVKVGDRKITVMTKKRDIDADSSCVDLRFDYFDERSDVEDNVPFMGEVNFELNKEE